MIKATWNQFLEAVPIHAILFPTLIVAYFLFGTELTVGFVLTQLCFYLLGAFSGAAFFAWLNGRDLD